MVNKRQYKNNRPYRMGYDDGFDDGFGKGLRKSRNKIDELTNDILEAERIQDKLTTKNNTLKATNSNLKATNSNLKATNSNLKATNRKQRNELEEQEIKLEEQEIKLEEQEIKLEEQEFELNVQRGRLDGLKERQQEIDADVRKLEEEYQNNLDEIKRLGVESDDLESDIFGIDKDLIQLRDNPIFTDELRDDFSRLRRKRQDSKQAKLKKIKSNQRKVNKLIKVNEGVMSSVNTLKVKSYDLTRDEIRRA